jgi:hypothetical protein
MKCWRQSFNIYLLAVLLAAGCETGGLSPTKDYSKLRIYMEGQESDGTLVRVGRDKTPIYVKAEPILTEEDVEGARVEENADGTLGIQVKFSDHGGIVLDMESTANRGRHLVVFCQFRPGKNTSDEAATELGKSLPWMAMVPIRVGLTGGVVHFTVPATQAEAQQIVQSINNSVAELQKLGN